MPRRDSSASNKRRNAPKGSTAKRQLVHHTAESKEDLEALAKRWGEPNANAVVRRALREAVRATLRPC